MVFRGGSGFAGDRKSNATVRKADRDMVKTLVIKIQKGDCLSQYRTVLNKGSVWRIDTVNTNQYKRIINEKKQL